MRAYFCAAHFLHGAETAGAIRISNERSRSQDSFNFSYMNDVQLTTRSFQYLLQPCDSILCRIGSLVRHALLRNTGSMFSILGILGEESGSSCQRLLEECLGVKLGRNMAISCVKTRPFQTKHFDDNFAVVLLHRSRKGAAMLSRTLPEVREVACSGSS